MNDKKLSSSEERMLDTRQEEFVFSQDDLPVDLDAFQKFFEMHPDAMAISGARDQVYYRVNKSFEKLLGYSQCELAGKNSHDFNMWFDLTDRKKIIDEILENGFIKNYEGKFRTKDGNIKYGRLSTSLVSTESAPLLCTTIHDITEYVLNEEALRESQFKYRELSVTDHLTGLYNSGHFRTTISAEVDRVMRQPHEQPLSVMFMDLDNFKSVNDTYGHLAGDAVLREIAGFIKGQIRKIDSAYRYGGEEFSIILPATDKRQACIVAEKIRMKIRSESILVSPEVAIKKTVSIGVAQYRKGEKIDDLIGRADNRMYLAKHGGKDRVYSSE